MLDFGYVKTVGELRRILAKYSEISDETEINKEDKHWNWLKSAMKEMFE